MKKVSLIMMFCWFLCGCSALDWVADNADVAQPVVMIATMKAVEAEPNHPERARKIAQYAQDAKSYLDGPAITLSEFEGAIRDRLGVDSLSPSDALLAGSLVSALMEKLNESVGDGVLDPDARLRINTVLDWIIEAAEIYY